MQGSCKKGLSLAPHKLNIRNVSGSDSGPGRKGMKELSNGPSKMNSSISEPELITDRKVGSGSRGKRVQGGPQMAKSKPKSDLPKKRQKQADDQVVVSVKKGKKVKAEGSNGSEGDGNDQHKSVEVQPVHREADKKNACTSRSASEGKLFKQATKRKNRDDQILPDKVGKVASSSKVRKTDSVETLKVPSSPHPIDAFGEKSHPPKKMKPDKVKSGAMPKVQPADKKSSGSSHKPSTKKSKPQSEAVNSKPSNKQVTKVTSPKKKDKHQAKQHSQEPKESSPAAISVQLDANDPMALLMMMEGIGGSKPVVPTQVTQSLSMSSISSIPSTSAGHTSASMDTDTEEEEEKHMAKAMTTDSESEEGMSDWEEVHDHHLAPERSQIPDKPVEITLEMPDILKKRKKKAFDWKLYLERRVRRFKREVAVDMHKVHLLCLLSLGMQQNDALNDPTLRGVLLSLLPGEFVHKTKLSEERQIENLLLWYKRKFTLENITHCSDTTLVPASTLATVMSKGSITDARVWVLIFISILRTVGLTVRLILSFQPMPFKVSQESGESKNKGHGKPMPNPAKIKGKGGPSKSTASGSQKSTPVSQSSPKKTSSAAKHSQTKSKSSSASKGKSLGPERRLSARESSKKAALKNKKALKDQSGDEEDDYKDEDVRFDGYADDPDSDFSEEEMKAIKEVKRKKKVKKKIKSEDDKLPRKALSPPSSDDETVGRRRQRRVGHDFWLEVFVPSKQRWICFDCFRCQFGKPHSLENAATQPLTYVVGFRNDGSVKDLTARYAKQWMSQTRKMRVDPEWWTQTLFLFDNTPYKEHLAEDDEIKGQLLVRPMPTNIADFKSHPLYALRRHLLKFEAIYPDDAPPLGFIRKEPVYARECVRTLHSRDNWLKEGRLVRLNEKPYKMVKSRPKWNKPKENPDELDLELFGEWQTEKYIPPPAVNGKVPKNEYGNVELFKPWMLPTGTVQLRGEGMKRVAKKLDIDIAPAMIGWDHHSGHAHPVMDGWIVCEEFADTLMAAWEEDVEIQRQREQEKREKRVYGNWRQLIRGLLIKERLKTKFLQEAPQVEKETDKPETFSDGEEARDVQYAWPQKRQDEIKAAKSKAGQLKAKRHKEIVEKGIMELSEGLDEKKKKMTLECDSEDDAEQSKMPVEEASTSIMKENGRVGGKIVVNAMDSKVKARKRGAGIRQQGGSKRKANDSDADDFEDPKFVVGKVGRKCPWSKNGGKGNSKVVVKDEDEEDDDDDVDEVDGDVTVGEVGARKGSRRTSLARKARKKAIVESESDGDESEDVESDVDETRQNKASGNKNVSARTEKDVTAKKRSISESGSDSAESDVEKMHRDEAVKDEVDKDVKNTNARTRKGRQAKMKLIGNSESHNNKNEVGEMDSKDGNLENKISSERQSMLIVKDCSVNIAKEEITGMNVIDSKLNKRGGKQRATRSSARRGK